MPLPLLEIAERPRQTADTSLLAFEALQPLKELDMRWFAAIWQYLEDTGYSDVSGKELADYYGVLATTTRPRLTTLLQRKWLLKGPIRASRVPLEKHCRGYRPAVPRAAIARLRQAQR